MWSIILSLSLISAPAKLFTERIEARVGSQIITSTDVQQVAKELQQGALENKSSQTIEKRALDRLIEQALIKEYLRSVQMEVSDQDVERRINSIRSSQGVASLDEFKNYIENQGLSFASFKKQVREQMELAQFHQIIQRQSLQTISENELKAYYQANHSEFQNNYELSLRECLIPYGEEKDEVLKRAQDFKSNPKAFSKCVQSFSRSPSRQQDGLIGSFRSGSLREEVEQAVFSLQPGSVAIIQLPGAVQLLKVESKKDLGPRDFESVKDEIRRSLESQRIEKARTKLLSELRSSTFIKVES